MPHSQLFSPGETADGKCFLVKGSLERTKTPRISQTEIYLQSTGSAYKIISPKEENNELR